MISISNGNTRRGVAVDVTIRRHLLFFVSEDESTTTHCSFHLCDHSASSDEKTDINERGLWSCVQLKSIVLTFSSFVDVRTKSSSPPYAWPSLPTEILYYRLIEVGKLSKMLIVKRCGNRFWCAWFLLLPLPSLERFTLRTEERPLTREPLHLCSVVAASSCSNRTNLE